MTQTAPKAARTKALEHPAPVFPRILCAVRGVRADAEAERQAALLAGPSGRLTYMGVYDPPTVSRRHVTEALASAKHVADGLGASRRAAEVVQARDPASALIDAAAGYDLLVVGPSPASRAQGITFGRVATVAAHTSPVPVLVARRCPKGVEFASRILLASDGSDCSRTAAELTARIAAAFQSEVTALHVAGRGDAERRHELAVEAADIVRDLDVDPVVMDTDLSVHEAISQVAEHERTTLLVVGSRGLSGLKALGSVSERVAHTAPCSVLIAR